MSFQIKATKMPILRLPQLTANGAKKLGEVLIQANRDRLAKGLGVRDQPMLRYSPRRIYVPVGGKGRGTISKKLRAFKKAGLPIGRNRKNGTYVTSSGSISYPNRAAYKRAIGRTGRRDFYETGAMLKDMSVVKASRREILIGWKSLRQEAKAAGNQRIDEGLGVSPQDEKKVMDAATVMFQADVDKINNGG